MHNLNEKKCFIFDMDGTVYLENELIDGSKELFDYFLENNIDYYFLTNNSSKSVEEYMLKLERLGIKASKQQVITSTLSTIAYLKNNYDVSKETFFLVGTEQMKAEFVGNGLNVITEITEGIEDAKVVVGFDTSLRYEKLTAATYYLKRNNTIVASNCDLVCPLKGNELTPDCAAIVALLTAAIPSKVVYCGKPELAILSPILENGFKTEEMVIVGDRLYTDIKLGFDNDIATILVRTGEEKTANDIENSLIQPTYVMDSIKQIFNELVVVKC